MKLFWRSYLGCIEAALLQPIFQFPIAFEIYKICIPLQSSDLNVSSFLQNGHSARADALQQCWTEKAETFLTRSTAHKENPEKLPA